MNYYYCYNVKIGLFDSEIKYAKEKGIYLYYDSYEDAFFDKDSNLIDITNKPIFPRSSITTSKSLVDAVIRHGGHSIVNQKDYDITLNWPYYIKTKRTNIILSGRQIIDNKDLIIKLFGNDKIFFKTKHKNFSQIIDVSSLLKSTSPLVKTIEKHEDEDFIISDAVTIEKDENGPLEFRAFVVQKEILNISRISDNLLDTIPETVINRLKSIVEDLSKTDFPQSYAIDLFIYKDKLGNRVVDVLECNPIIASGTYLYNSIFEKQSDLEHRNLKSSIPKEKQQYIPIDSIGYNAVIKTTPSIFYHLKGGFAADLSMYTVLGAYEISRLYSDADELQQDLDSSEQLFEHMISDNMLIRKRSRK